VSVHDYNDALPGYSASQVLHDGCGECEDRATSPDRGISRLDQHNFILAWHRATQWNKTGLSDVAAAEMPMLQAIWSIQLQLERLGVPIGTLPVAPVDAAP
jgi:hypothetical protein